MGYTGHPQKVIRAKVSRFPYYNGEYRNQTFDVEKIPHPVFEINEDIGEILIDGTYDVIVRAAGSEQEGSFTSKTDGNILTGTATAMGNTAEIEDGKVDGNRFSHSMTMKTPMGKMKIQDWGKIEDDLITGTLKSMMMSMPFSGKRVG